MGRIAHVIVLAVGLGWTVGCASSAGQRRGHAGEVRKLTELPQDYSELWLGFMEGRSDWPELRAAALQDPAKEAFLVDNLVRTLLRSFQRGTSGDSGDPVTLLFRRSGRELVLLESASAPALAELLALGKGRGPALASELLIRIGVGGLPPLVEQLGRADHVNARRRAAALLAEMPYGLNGIEDQVRAALIERLESDEDWLVRERSAHALTERALRDTTVKAARVALCRALSDEDHDVRRRAATGLARIEDPGAVPALINLLERSTRDADPGGLAQAQEALLRITRQTQRRSPREWRTWWRGNRPVTQRK